ncbi:hypothetical protein K439DRAFT_1630094 [Ramaria rubella]|nr:hypothetical protein K439DRAFT_1630094 [Ramaria rubella]
MSSLKKRAYASVAPIWSWWLLLIVMRLVCADDVVTVIDDSDPAIKAVNGTWVHFTGAEYYNGTETLTREAGATTMYVFSGTGISVFGTQCDPAGGNTTVSTYVIDGGPASTYTEPPGIVCNQNFFNFFSSPPLINGQHTLYITNLNNNAWFFIDYLQVTSPAATASSTNAVLSASLAGASSPASAILSASTSPIVSSPTASSATATAAAAATTAASLASELGSYTSVPAPGSAATLSSPPTSAPDSNPTPSSVHSESNAISTSRPMSMGAMVGIAVGGAAVVAIFIVALVLWRKMKQSSKKPVPEEGSLIQTGERRGDLSPYLISSASPSSDPSSIASPFSSDLLSMDPASSRPTSIDHPSSRPPSTAPPSSRPPSTGPPSSRPPSIGYLSSRPPSIGPPSSRPPSIGPPPPTNEAGYANEKDRSTSRRPLPVPAIPQSFEEFQRELYGLPPSHTDGSDSVASQQNRLSGLSTTTTLPAYVR